MSRDVPAVRMTRTPFEREAVAKLQSAICAMGCAVNVYVTRRPLALALRRTTVLRRRIKRLPHGAEFLGCYDQPFNTEWFLDDLAAHLAAPPPMEAADAAL